MFSVHEENLEKGKGGKEKILCFPLPLFNFRVFTLFFYFSFRLPSPTSRLPYLAFSHFSLFASVLGIFAFAFFFFLAKCQFERPMAKLFFRIFNFE